MIGLGTSLSHADSTITSILEADELGAFSADLDIWFDFSDASTVVGVQDAAISDIRNLGQAGAEYNIDAVVDEPTIDHLLMHKQSVKFNGTSNEALSLAAPYTTTGKAYTWFIVLYRPDDSNDAIIASAADGAEYFQLRGSGASIKIAKADMSSDKTITFSSTGGSTINYTYQDASDAGSNGIQVIVYNRSSTGVVNIYNHLEDYIATSTNSVVKSAADMTVGALGATSSGSITDFTGNIGEFGVFDADIGGANSKKLAGNLARKWGAATI